jgi:hypothetical protein
MTNPWLEVPLADYEAHMALPAVAQAQMLADIFQKVVSSFRPNSLAVLGVAGGNGLAFVDPAIVRRLVAVDINPEYLKTCVGRYATTFATFEPVAHDLSEEPPAIEPVDCIFAGLVLEYINVERFCAALPMVLKEQGVFRVILQLPSPHLPEVSDSPYTSLSRLKSAFSFVNPVLLEEYLCESGFSMISSNRFELPSGKSFHHGVYRLSKVQNK